MKPFYVSLEPFLDHSVLPRPTDWAGVFGSARPLEVEIGFGNGEYLAGLAQAFPQVNFIGFEEYCERITRTLRKLSRTGLGNARVLRLDARAGFERYIAPRSIARVHCLYPPPWPKKSDAKHRLFTGPFLDLVNSRLVDGGILKVVTDHYPYIAWIQEHVAGTGFSVAFKTIPASYGTKFEKKWAAGGQSEFYELVFTKQEHIHVPLTEDTPLQTYTVDVFNPDRFVLEEYSSEGIAVAFKDILYDPKKKTALIHVMACEGPIAQNIRIVVAHTPKGWRIHLAEGTMLMPTLAVAKALECVHRSALATA